MSDAGRLAEEFELGLVARVLGQAAGAAHDIFHDSGPGLDELRSFKWLELQLEKASMPDKYINMPRLAILGTEPLFEGSRWAGQKAFEQEYDSELDELFAHALAAADMGAVFTPEGPYMGHLLYQERLTGPNRQSLADFQADQIVFLNDFKRRPAGASVLDTHRREVIEHAENIYSQICTGSITSLDNVLARDRDFMLEHRA
jgi:hypothetical protein